MTASLAAVTERVGGRLEASENAATELVDASHDSRQIDRGWLFCAVPGAAFDGHDFAAAAVDAGAGALLVERPLDLDRPQIVVPDVRAAMGPAAAAIHGDPSDQLTVVGVTGTNGKSSIVQLLSDIWSQVGQRSAIIGTLVGARTTPEATDLQRELRRVVDDNVRALAMEVSSHALALHRVAGARFEIAVFTNLTQDHLDFHHTMEEYFEAKALLFEPSLTNRAVVNIDDPWGRRLHERAAVPTEPFALVDAENLVYRGATSRFRWRGHEVTLQLAGAHNVSNALAAARCAELLGMEAADIADALCATSPVRGRFEAVDAGQPFHIAVDYAHTPDALRAALAASRQVVDGGRVIVVFGCGGDRDVEKRADMGRVADEAADVVVVTSDNPRSEEPGDIITDILEGIDRTVTEPRRSGVAVGDAALIVEPDRQGAIDAAIEVAAPGDLVLIAGKGHETYQIIGDQTIEFDDREAALISLGVIA